MITSKKNLLFLLFIPFVSFSQENVKKHLVKKGESVYQIAKTYHTTINAIYDQNPTAKNGLQPNTYLLLPTKEGTSSINTNNITNQKIVTHTVLEKETLYGITKKYNISLKDLQDANSFLLQRGLKIGDELKISTFNSSVSISGEPEQQLIPTVHTVMAHETLYSIAKKYQLKLSDIASYNPAIANNALAIGQKIVLVAPAVLEEKSSDKQAATATTIPENVSEYKPNPTKVVNEVKVTEQLPLRTESDKIVHTVLLKETEYSISKKYGLTIKELENQNPTIKNNLYVGQQLTIVTNVVLDNDKSNKEESVVNTTTELTLPTTFKGGNEFLDQLIATASENIGVRYRFGGTTKEGFDCSGFMCSTFGSFDIQLPRTSREQAKLGVVVGLEEAKKGDLIFFNTSGGSKNYINHVGMVVEVADGDIKFIHASSSNGVIISSVKENYYTNRVVQVNRVL